MEVSSVMMPENNAGKLVVLCSLILIALGIYKILTGVQVYYFVLYN